LDARRSRVGLDPWRLKLLWFGHPTNVAPLLRGFAGVGGVRRPGPLCSNCVTQPGTQLDGKVTASTAAPSVPLRIISSPWSLDYMPFAFGNATLSSFRSSLTILKKNAKSNNRLVDALHAGRFTVAHPYSIVRRSSATIAGSANRLSRAWTGSYATRKRRCGE